MGPLADFLGGGKPDPQSVKGGSCGDPVTAAKGAGESTATGSLVEEDFASPGGAKAL